MRLDYVLSSNLDVEAHYRRANITPLKLQSLAADVWWHFWLMRTLLI
jgi:hypothetical protein